VLHKRLPYAHRAGRKVDIAPFQGHYLTPPQTPERRDQDQRPEVLRHPLDQVEDLRDGQHRSFGGLLLVGTDDAARVNPNQFVLLDGGP
jgi:hypothetical protein